MGISASVANKKTSSVLPIDVEAGKTSLEKANWYFEQGNYTQAEEFFRVALEEAKVRYGEDNVETLAVQNNLGVVYCKQGHVEEAASLHEHVLEHYIHLLGSKHPLSLQAQHNLGLALFQGQRFGEAAKEFESSYHGRLAMLGSSHVDTLSSMEHLSMCYLEEGRFADAEEVLRVCLSKQRFLLGPDHHLVITLTILQCRALKGLGKYAESVELCRSALKLCSESSKGSVASEQWPPVSCSWNNFCKVTVETHDDFNSLECATPMAWKCGAELMRNSNSTVELTVG